MFWLDPPGRNESEACFEECSASFMLYNVLIQEVALLAGKWPQVHDISWHQLGILVVLFQNRHARHSTQPHQAGTRAAGRDALETLDRIEDARSV